jgi:hypothetical protein
MKRHLIMPILLSLLSALPAEDVRAKVVEALELSSEASDGEKASLTYADAAGIFLPADLGFIDGIELELRIPPAVQAMKGSFIFFIYKGVRPFPDLKTVSYSGERVAMLVVPSRVSQVYQIPLSKNTTLKNSPYAILLPKLEERDFPILFRLMPAIKGLPGELETAAFQLKAKPIYIDEGRVRLSFTWAEGVDQDAPLSVWIDDKELKDPRESFMLKPGAHTLRVSGSEVRDKFQTFSVSQARNHEIEIALEDVTPRLVLEYPERTKIELDGKVLGPKEAKDSIALQPGEHTVGFSVGDYTIQRRIQVQRGKTYRVSLLVDVKVEEAD